MNDVPAAISISKLKDKFSEISVKERAEFML